MKLRIINLVALFILPLLFLSTAAWHGLMAPMPDAMSMQPNDCLSACGGKLQQHVVTVTERKAKKEEDRYPEETEPYYVQFMQLTSFVNSVDAAYFLRHLQWRPPDLIKLTTAYRI